MQQVRTRISTPTRWVIKIGSALATNDGQGLQQSSIDAWAAQAAALCQRGYEVVLVTSGAVAEGVLRLGWKTRPSSLHELQAAAAVGQMGLIQTYESAFQRYGLHTAQILLTHDDLASRRRYLNARSTLQTLIGLKVIPVINENDTVATDELRFGDNDTLAGLIANLIQADLLVLLTDQLGLYERDPRKDPTAKIVSEARAGDPALEIMAGDGGKWGRGGMRTKLRAATLAARSGTATIIASGATPNILCTIAAGESVGTLLVPVEEPIAARKQWLAGGLKPRGKLWLDDGAVRVLRQQGRSLLAVGVTLVEGEFTRGDLVSCVDARDNEIGRGLINYSSNEVRSVRGLPSEKIVAVLGYIDEPELIHRDNFVVVS